TVRPSRRIIDGGIMRAFVSCVVLVVMTHAVFADPPGKAHKHVKLPGLPTSPGPHDLLLGPSSALIAHDNDVNSTIAIVRLTPDLDHDLKDHDAKDVHAGDRDKKSDSDDNRVIVIADKDDHVVLVTDKDDRMILVRDGDDRDPKNKDHN